MDAAQSSAARLPDRGTHHVPTAELPEETQTVATDFAIVVRNALEHIHELPIAVTSLTG
jgi:hypothetical protein